jgi:hypothetical protein
MVLELKINTLQLEPNKYRTSRTMTTPRGTLFPMIFRSYNLNPMSIAFTRP